MSIIRRKHGEQLQISKIKLLYCLDSSWSYCNFFSIFSMLFIMFFCFTDTSSSSKTVRNQDALCSFPVELHHQQIAINHRFPTGASRCLQGVSQWTTCRPVSALTPLSRGLAVSHHHHCICQPTLLWLVPTVVSPRSYQCLQGA